jgi:hypothetical protein
MITFWEKQKIQRKEGWIASDSLIIPALRRTGFEKQRKTACFLGKRKQAVFSLAKNKGGLIWQQRITISDFGMEKLMKIGHGNICTAKRSGIHSDHRTAL